MGLINLEEANMEHVYDHFSELKEFMQNQKRKEFELASIDYKKFMKGKDDL